MDTYDVESSSLFSKETNLSVISPTDAAPTKHGFWQYKTSQSLFIYIPPFILLFGVTGNILAALVMSMRRMRKSPSGLYIRGIAVADTLVLLIGFTPEWVRSLINVDITRINEWICKSRKFIFYGSGDISVWLLTAFTIDRFIAVCFPLHKKHLCTHKRIRIITVIILVIGVLVNLHLFWTVGIEYEYKNGNATIKDKCGHPSPAIKYFSRNIRPWMVLVYYNILPFSIILFCNIAIIRIIMRMRSRDVGKKQVDVKKGKQQFSNLTAMAVSISFALLLLTTPGIIIYSVKPKIQKDGYSQAVYSLVKAIGDLLMYTNHSINFYLYCLTGTKFRQELKSMFRRRRTKREYLRRAEENNSTTSTVMRHVNNVNLTPTSVLIQKQSPNGQYK